MSNGVLEAFYSLGRKVNKAMGRSTDQETEQGVVSDKFPELTLSIDNSELISLAKKWKKVWVESDVYNEWVKHGDENEDYWLGKQFQQPKVDKSRPLVDNVIFESLETYLPQVTRRNPEPMVTLVAGEDQSPENLKYASDLQKRLGYIADEAVVRLKLKKAARHWAIYLLGAIKVGWNIDKDIPTAKVIRPRKLILDPNSTNDEDGYSGNRVGEIRKLSAGEIIDTLKNVGGEKEAEKVINDLAKDSNGVSSLGTEIQFTEWWTKEYMFWEIDQQYILLKKKNPHWNGDVESEAPYDDNGEPQLDESGNPVVQSSPGVNHFPAPDIPFLFLSVFNLGKQPVDETSLIGQSLASQDVINKRNKQIDKNADSMNGGMVVSGERSGLTKDQAKGVTEALRRGGTVFVPAGNVSEAVARMSAPALPADIYLQLQDMRTRTRDVFGVSGSSSAGLASERTVRGKIQNRVLDTDRIGGGFSEYLEQLADNLYNWFVQLLYVYDDNFAAGNKPKVNINVKEGSLLPKDSTTVANQAIELANSGRMALVDLYKNLDYPNPTELAANVWLENNAPELLLGDDPRVAQVLESRRQATDNKPPSKSINFKDLPPEGQAQLAKQAGIELNAEGIAAYNQDQRSIEQPTELPQ